uniref:methyl-accepting chemotaxis protein n=1 Tax=Ningiella ruwaisensis TaxID=2364274 RepID=UPI001445FC33|nr:methyl-accepting chemotaxis protein [Ningiella ruwaisensis]
MFSVLKNLHFERLLGKSYSLKQQLSKTFLLVGLLPLLLISIIATWLASSMTTDMANQNLEALKANKVVAIEKYGSTIVNQVLTASNDPNTATNLKSVIRGFENAITQSLDKQSEQNTLDEALNRLGNELAQYYNNEFLPRYQTLNDGQGVDTNALISALNPEAILLQHAYIQNNPAPLGSKHEMFESALGNDYDSAHKLLHQSFKEYLERFGYYDIFLVDNKGFVVYSVYKELDFATNLLTGPYASSGLGQAFQASLNLSSPDEYALIDYAQYTPSYEAPASFISSPVFDGNIRIGTLIFQMPLDAITAVMSERRGLGETGESYLVGEDMLMRSDSLKFPDSYSVDASFRDGRQVNTEAVTLGLSGKSGVIEQVNYQNEPVISGFIPVKFGSLDWVLIAEIESGEAYAAVSKLRWIVIGICLGVIGLVIYIAMRVSDKIIAPVDAMKAAMASIAENTDFSQRVQVQSKDEIGQSATSLNLLLEKLEVSIKETNDVVTAMSNGDFERQVESDFQGDLLTLKQGVNRSSKAMKQSISEVNRVVGALAKGDFNTKITAEMQGDLASLKDGVNTSADAVAEAIHHIMKLINAMSSGNFNYKANASLVGEYDVLAKQADSAMSSIDSALNQIDTVMADVANGKLSSRVSVALPGQLDDIKVKLNSSLDAVSNVFSETEQVLKSLSQGKLNKKIHTEFPGQFNILKVSANATVEKLTEVVYEIKQASVTVSAGAEDIASGNSSLSARTEQQASDLEQTAASMDEITSTVKHTADNAVHANNIASEAKQHAQTGGKVVKEAVVAMEEINQASARIADIISVIDSIAFQTNLLALNAAVEAARAGEQGRGFAVVASEVRNLAGRSANAAKEIKSLIEDTVNKVEAGSELVNKSGKTLADIIQEVDNVSSIVSEISTAANEQSVGISEIHKAIESLQMLTQQNTALVEEAAAASEELGSQAKGMNELMEFFEVEETQDPLMLVKAS